MALAEWWGVHTSLLMSNDTRVSCLGDADMVLPTQLGTAQGTQDAFITGLRCLYSSPGG